MLEWKQVELEDSINDENEQEYKTEKKIIKGEIYFFLKNGYIETSYKEYTDAEKSFVNMYPTEYEIYDLMSGIDFADNVECGGFIDYDGSIAQIFVDDYKSNLGIWDHGIHQGKFCLGQYDFRKLCEKYNIEVNWANR